MKFYIIDDDPSIIRILENIINNHQLGVIIGKSESSKKAIDEIIDLRPEIVLIDLLLPEIDGINIINEIHKYDDSISFIMVSEVNTKDMIAKAFTKGIEYYIAKPINVIESKAIIKKVIEKRKNIDLIESYKNILDQRSEMKRLSTSVDMNGVIQRLNQVGVAGIGKIDLAKIILYIIKNEEQNEFYNKKMFYYYNYISRLYLEAGEEVSPKTIKQRIRRGIIDSFKSIASLGLEDFLNPVFTESSSTLFKFSEIRKEMNYLKGKSDKGGTFDVKRFIGGMIIILNR